MNGMIGILEIFYNIDVKAIDHKKHRKIYDRLKEADRWVTGIDFGDTLNKLKGKYLDMYDGIKPEVLSTTKFDENLDLSTTYLGRIHMSKLDKIKAEENFPTLEQGYK